MRFTSLFITTLLLLVVLSQAWSQGLAAGAPPGPQVLTWESLADRGALQMENNNTTPSFSELVPIIIFVLAGVGIAIVVVAAGLWIAGRRRRGSAQTGGRSGEGEKGEKGEKGEDEEWGAKWEP